MEGTGKVVGSGARKDSGLSAIVTSPWTVLVAIGLSLLAACGTDNSDNDTVDEGTAPVLTLASSGARWINTDGSLSEFDVSVQKTDGTVLGVEVWWDYGIDDPEARLGPSFDAVVTIDGQPNFGTPVLSGFLREGRLETDSMSIVETDSGFLVVYRLGRVLGASDLTDDEGNPVVLADASIEVDFEEGEVTSDFEFVEDLDRPGELDYAVALRGTLSVGTGANEKVDLQDGPVTFTTVESNPDAVHVEDDADAVAALEAADDATAVEAAGCVTNSVEIVGSGFTLSSADGSATIRSELPDEWAVERSGNDPCFVPGVKIAGPEQPGGPAENPAISVNLWTLNGEMAQSIAENWSTTWNVVGYKEDGEPIPLDPSDESYTSFDPVVEESLLGRTAYRVTGTTADSVLNSVTLVVEAGPGNYVQIDYIFFRGDDSLATPFFETFVSGTVITTE